MAPGRGADTARQSNISIQPLSPSGSASMKPSSNNRNAESAAREVNCQSAEEAEADVFGAEDGEEQKASREFPFDALTAAFLPPVEEIMEFFKIEAHLRPVHQGGRLFQTAGLFEE